MIGLQPGHIVIIILIAVLIFAPSSLHKLVRGFKGMFSQFRNDVSSKNRSKNISTEPSNKPKV